MTRKPSPWVYAVILSAALALVAAGLWIARSSEGEPDPYEAILDTNPSEFYENYTPPGQELSPERKMLEAIWDVTEAREGDLVYLCSGYEDDPHLVIGMLAVELEADPTDVRWLLDEKC